MEKQRNGEIEKWRNREIRNREIEQQRYRDRKIEWDHDSIFS